MPDGLQTYGRINDQSLCASNAQVRVHKKDALRTTVFRMCCHRLVTSFETRAGGVAVQEQFKKERETCWYLLQNVQS